MAPLALETQGVFISDDRKRVFDEIRAAAERVLKEFAGAPNIDAEAVARGIRSRVRDVLRRRSSSYAVVLPIVSIAGRESSTDETWLEKEFF